MNRYKNIQILSSPLNEDEDELKNENLISRTGNFTVEYTEK